jgi:hypothetical protein
MLVEYSRQERFVLFLSILILGFVAFKPLEPDGVETTTHTAQIPINIAIEIIAPPMVACL